MAERKFPKLSKAQKDRVLNQVKAIAAADELRPKKDAPAQQ